jgi:hypothetical protein
MVSVCAIIRFPRLSFKAVFKPSYSLNSPAIYGGVEDLNFKLSPFQRACPNGLSQTGKSVKTPAVFFCRLLPGHKWPGYIKSFKDR